MFDHVLLNGLTAQRVIEAFKAAQKDCLKQLRPYAAYFYLAIPHNITNDNCYQKLLDFLNAPRDEKTDEKTFDDPKWILVENLFKLKELTDESQVYRIIQAVKTGLLFKIKYPDFELAYQNSPLSEAILMGDKLLTAKMVKQTKANPLYPDRNNIKPFTKALRANKIEMVEQLVQLISFTRRQVYQELYKAMSERDELVFFYWVDFADKGNYFRKMSEAEPSILEMESSSYQTLLDCAVKTGKFIFIKTLIDQDADFNQTRTQHGASAYWQLLLNDGHDDTILSLIQYDKFNFTQFSAGELLLELARLNQLELIKALFLKIKKYVAYVILNVCYHRDTFNYALHWVAAHGNVEAVTFLLDWGADPNQVNKAQRTPMAIAMKNKDDLTVKAILGHKSHNFSRESAIIALIWAAHVGNLDWVKLVMIFAVDELNLFLSRAVFMEQAFDQQKNTVLHFAAVKSDVPMMDFLLNEGADSTKINSHDCSPLARLLLRWGQADDNSKEHYTVGIEMLLWHPRHLFTWQSAKSALLAAAKTGSVAMFKQVTEVIQRVDAFRQRDQFIKLLNECVDKAGNSLLHIAVKRQHREMARLLLACDIDTHKKNAFGQLAKDLADRNTCGLFADQLNWYQKLQMKLRAAIDAPVETGKSCQDELEADDDNNSKKSTHPFPL